MKVLLVRHGVAEDQDAFARTGAPDDLRPLTAAGADEMREVSLGLKRIVKEINVIAASPLTRAQQTADIVAEAFQSALRETTTAMTPDAHYPEFIEWVKSKRQRKCIAAVGHDPHISGLAAWLLGAAEGAVEMKKGSALMLEFDDAVQAGGAKLRWYIAPAQIKKLVEH